MRFADIELAQRLESTEMLSTLDHVDTARRLAPGEGSARQAIGDGLAVFVGPRSPINRVYGLGMSGPVRDKDLDRAERFFAERNEPPRVDLCPLAHDSMRKLLAARGYTVQMFKQVWWRALENVTPLTPPHPSLRVEIVTEINALLWAQVVGAAFSGQASLADADTSISLVNVHKEHTTCFLAWIDDAPAGGGAIAIHQGVATLFSTSVRPAVRRMGVQQALIDARLRFAVDAGCDLCTVSTTPGSASQRNVERFGFRLAYTKPTMLRTKP